VLRRELAPHAAGVRIGVDVPTIRSAKTAGCLSVSFHILAAMPDPVRLSCKSRFSVGNMLLPELDRFGVFSWKDAITCVGRNVARVLDDRGALIHHPMQHRRSVANRRDGPTGVVKGFDWRLGLRQVALRIDRRLATPWRGERQLPGGIILAAADNRPDPPPVMTAYPQQAPPPDRFMSEVGYVLIQNRVHGTR